MFRKGRKIGETSGRNFRKISQIPKIRENFPRKFPENFPEISRKIPGVFDVNAMIQIRNIIFYYCKSNKHFGKFRENFGENSRNVKNSRKKFPRKISRKFWVFFSVKYNGTERKSIFLCL